MARRKELFLEKGRCSSRRNRCIGVAYVICPCLLYLFVVRTIIPIIPFDTFSITSTTTTVPGGNKDRVDGVEEKDPSFATTDPVPESESAPLPDDDSADSENKCDIFDGKWVRDPRAPFYPLGSCPYVDTMFDCFKNKRPDDGYLYWRWQPNHCDIPRMNATDFLERLRGQRLVLVGDSLNRNMFESLICILRQSIPNKRRVFEISGATNLKARPYSCVRFEDYNCSVEFVRANHLVKLNQTKGQKSYRVRLDRIEDSASGYREADILIFNTGRWWKTVKKWEYVFQEGDYTHKALPTMEACKRGMRTWASWVDRNIDPNKTQIFYRAFSPNHSNGRQWHSHGKCHRETEPIKNETFLGKYPDYSILAENILRGMKTPVTFLNVSRLADYRKDGHTSIYVKRYTDEKERNETIRNQDCGHWCLPGVPDVWNELLYASLLQIGRGSWKF